MTISIRKFIKTVEKKISAYNKKELENILKEMALNISTENRETFLETLKPVDKASQELKNIISKNTLLKNIKNIKENIKEDMEKCHENQHLYVEYYHDYDDCFENEEPYDEYYGYISDFFDRTQSVFESQDFELAYKAYIELFKIFFKEDDFSNRIYSYKLKNIEMTDQILFFLRSLYESTELEKRADKIFKQLTEIYYRYNFYHRKLISIQDIIDAHQIPLSNKDQFLKDWIELLKKHKDDKSKYWLREAILLSSGIEGLKAFALKHGEQQPRAYLEWISYYFDKKDFKETVNVAYIALKNLNKKLAIKSAIGDLLYKASLEINNKKGIQDGLWESFSNKPTLERLLNLVEDKDNNELKLILKKAEKIAKDYKTPKNNDYYDVNDFYDDNHEESVTRSEKLITHLELLNKKFSTVIEKSKKEDCLGWSYDTSSQGVLVPVFLLVISNMNSRSYFNIEKLWNQSVKNSFDRFSFDKNEKYHEKLKKLYKRVFFNFKFKDQDEKDYLEFCVNLAHKRTEAFLAEKLRGHYWKAAMLISACSETFLTLNQKEKAEKIIHESVENNKRFSAYKRELKEASQHHITILK